MRVLALGEERECRPLGMRAGCVLHDVLQLLARRRFLVRDVAQFHFGRPVLRQAEPVLVRAGEAMAGVKKRIGRRFLNLSGDRGAEACQQDEGEASQWGGSGSQGVFAVIPYVR